MRRTFMQVRLLLRWLKRCDSEWATPSVTTLEFVAAGIAIDRLGGYEHLVECAATNGAAEYLISGFSAADWSFIQRLVDELPG